MTSRTGPLEKRLLSTMVVLPSNSSGVDAYFNSDYSKDESGNHFITDESSGNIQRVMCGKVVMINTKVIVPSMREGSPFPVDPKVQLIPVNGLAEQVRSAKHSEFIVIGAGKTGADAIIHLLRNGVDQSDITWIVSRDVFFLVRDGYIKPGLNYWQNISRFLKPLVSASSLMETILEFEKDGIVARLDTDNLRPCPEVLRGATVDKDELALLRSVKSVVRLGRVTNITSDSIVLDKGSVPVSPADTLILDCMSNFDAGDFFGYVIPDNFRVYEPTQINLGPLFIAFNPCLSAAITAFLEIHLEDDDSTKNGMLYFPAGKGFVHTPLNFFSMFYGQFKTIEALRKYPPAAMFYFNSRINVDSPQHHGGMLPFLWAAFGPLGLMKDGELFAKKYGNGHYADAKFFGCDRPLPEKIRAKKTKGKDRKSNVPYPPQKEKATKSGFNCCKSGATCVPAPVE